MSRTPHTSPCWFLSSVSSMSSRTLALPIQFISQIQASVPRASGSATRGQMCSLDQGRPLSGGVHVAFQKQKESLSDHFVSTRPAHLPVVTATSSESSGTLAHKWVTASPCKCACISVEASVGS
ncbi:hypothetical protein KL921_005413 [Ogataea angusta]|nr:hypothetical protein KL921_005413 [Ogataea angusta]